MMKWTKCAIRFLRISRPGVRVPSIAPENAVKSKDFMAFLFCKPWLHGFCTKTKQERCLLAVSGDVLSSAEIKISRLMRKSTSTRDFLLCEKIQLLFFCNRWMKRSRRFKSLSDKEGSSFSIVSTNSEWVVLSLKN